MATEDDVRSGRAVFFTQASGGCVVAPYSMPIPSCAILHIEEGPTPDVPVIIIQAEQVEHRVLVGYRFIEGGNGVGTLPDLTILSEPDQRFALQSNDNSETQLTNPS